MTNHYRAMTNHFLRVLRETPGSSRVQAPTKTSPFLFGGRGEVPQEPRAGAEARPHLPLGANVSRESAFLEVVWIGLEVGRGNPMYPLQEPGVQIHIHWWIGGLDWFGGLGWFPMYLTIYNIQAFPIYPRRTWDFPFTLQEPELFSIATLERMSHFPTRTTA